MLVLLLLLLGAFQWPGWLVSHKEAPRYSSNTTSAAVAPKAESPAANQVVLLGDDLSPKPLSSAQQPRLERKSLPSQAVAQLSSQLDAVHSYFLMAGSRDIVELTGVPELERLLGKIMASIAPVSADAIECEALANSLQLASPKSGSALHLKVDTFARYLLAASDVEEFRIDFKNWYLDHSKPILMQLPGASRASLALHFRPKAGSAAFESFRIVIIGEGGPPAPIQLSTAFLSVNQTNFADTVDFSLREKLELLVRPPSSQLQLRPFLGSKPLYDELGLNQPREGYELNLDAARDQMLRRMEIAEAGAEKLAATVLQLENSIAQANAADIQLGILLGHKPEDALASFAAFARSHNSKMNRLTFLGYLKAVLKKKLADQELDKLDRVESPPRILKDLPSLLAKAGFEEQLKGIGKDYFVARWKSLGLANQLTKMQAEKEKADFELLSWKLRSALVPPDLSGLSRVSLFLITNGSRPLELIRFTAP